MMLTYRKLKIPKNFCMEIRQLLCEREDGTLTITMANCSLEEDYEIQCSEAVLLVSF